MKKKSILKGIIIFAAIIALFWNLIVPIRARGRAANMVEDDYRGYYLMAKWRQGWFNFGTGWSWTLDIRFLPSQRTRLRQKIKKDIINDLETLINEHSDVFCMYEISDDFKGVRIYIVSGDVDGRKRGELRHEMGERLGALIELYQIVKVGYPVSIRKYDDAGVWTGEGVIFVEPDG